MTEKRVDRTFRYRLYPTRTQIAALEAQLDFACDLYNAGLEQRRDLWKQHRKRISTFDQQRQLTELRRSGGALQGMNATSQEAVLAQLGLAFEASFAESGKAKRRATQGSSRSRASAPWSGGVEMPGARLFGTAASAFKASATSRSNGTAICRASRSRRASPVATGVGTWPLRVRLRSSHGRRPVPSSASIWVFADSPRCRPERSSRDREFSGLRHLQFGEPVERQALTIEPIDPEDNQEKQGGDR